MKSGLCWNIFFPINVSPVYIVLTSIYDYSATFVFTKFQNLIFACLFYIILAKNIYIILKTWNVGTTPLRRILYFGYQTEFNNFSDNNKLNFNFLLIAGQDEFGSDGATLFQRCALAVGRRHLIFSGELLWQQECGPCRPVWVLLLSDMLLLTVPSSHGPPQHTGQLVVEDPIYLRDIVEMQFACSQRKEQLGTPPVPTQKCLNLFDPILFWKLP